MNDLIMGSAQTANVGGKTVRCIIEEITNEEIEIAGGRAESGGFRLSCVPIEALSPQPKKGDTVTARSQTLSVLNVVAINDATLTILAGSLLRGES